MRALSFAAFGGPEVLEVIDAPVPSPGPGRIRVAVAAAGVNPFDWKMRRGLFGGELPKRVGLEFAGVVDALGPQVTGVAAGDRVYGFAVGGGAAQFTLSAHWAAVPAGVSLQTAAGLPVAVETAYRILDAVGVAAGTTVLINGASGSVGQSAVQVAVSRGAHVIGTASEANHALVRALGAEPVTYGPGLADRVRALGVASLDGAVDAAGGGVLEDLVALADGPEAVVTIADYEGAQALGVTFSSQSSAYYALEDVAGLITEGRFRPPTVRTFPLQAAGEAQALSETGHIGALKLVLTV